jgi:hypothetical protein
MSEHTREALLLDLMMVSARLCVKSFVSYLDTHEGASLAEVEGTLWRLSRGLCATVLAAVISGRGHKVEYEVSCPQCGAAAQPKGKQARQQETLVGRVEWERRYYYCSSCRRGHYPLDEAWGVGAGQCSAGVQKEVARLAARMPFAEAAEDLEELTGVSLSGRTVGRIAEQRGAALEEHLQQETQAVLEQGTELAPAAVPPTEEGVWGVALDAGKIHLREGWHDADVGVVFQPRVQTSATGERQVRCAEPSYVAQISALEETGRRLYVESRKRGGDSAQETVVCLGDGAAGNWKQFATHFPHRVEVLDWYHAVEHLWIVGQGRYGEGSAPAAAWVKGQEQALWEGHPEQVVQTLRALAEEEHGQAAAEAIHYFVTNRGRMDYARYRAAGYPIGSGSAESGCKQLVNQRMKQAGMRWSPPGAQAILNLRAVLLGGQWEQAWPHTAPPRHPA